MESRQQSGQQQERWKASVSGTSVAVKLGGLGDTSCLQPKNKADTTSFVLKLLNLRFVITCGFGRSLLVPLSVDSIHQLLLFGLQHFQFLLVGQ